MVGRLRSAVERGGKTLVVRRMWLWTVTVVATLVLLASGAGWMLQSGAEEGELSWAVDRFGPWLAMLQMATAVGVVYLGWQAAKLAGTLASIADSLPDKAAGTGPTRRSLARGIADSFGEYEARIRKLGEQLAELQLSLELSRRREQNTEAIIQSIRDAVIVVDAFDKVVMANEAAGKLFGFDCRSAPQQTLEQLLGQSHSGFVQFVLESKQGKGRARRRELNIDDGERVRTFDCVVSCVYDEKDRCCGAVAILHDITREKEISQMKNDFVSHVSHELKTPLASIMAYSEMLVDGEVDDEQTRRKFYGVIQSQAERLSRLIEEILNISRIESGLVKVNKEPASLAMLIEEQMQMIKGYADEKGITLIGQRPIVFDQVYVDKDMITQVIVNLLSNAIKYTPAGGTVRIETQVDESSGLARVTVTDTGVGIPKEELPYVFDKFYRVRANNKQAKGTGLGLNLVKQIVEKVHGGRVFVSSEVGVGSTFGFELPLARVQTAGAV